MSKLNRPLIYIAGPMSGHPDFNYPLFDRYAKLLRDRGNFVINPAEVGSLFAPPEKIQADNSLRRLVIRAEKSLICQCDIIYLLPHWESSPGARDELEIALQYNLTIMLAEPLQSITVAELKS